MVPQPSAVLFDMDGTILDWQLGMEDSWRASCVELCDGSYEPAALHAAIRVQRDWYWEDPERERAGRLNVNEASRETVRRAFAELGLKVIDLANRIGDDYRARRAAHIVPYPGAIETLRTLRARRIRLALLTNGDAGHQRGNVERHGLAPYFDCIVIEGEFGAGKPDERVFRHALQAVSCAPEAAWMVGDSLEADIAPAVALGMHAVWVDLEGAGLPEGAPAQPHRIVRAISELV